MGIPKPVDAPSHNVYSPVKTARPGTRYSYFNTSLQCSLFDVRPTSSGYSLLTSSPPPPWFQKLSFDVFYLRSSGKPSRKVTSAGCASLTSPTATSLQLDDLSLTTANWPTDAPINGSACLTSLE